MSLNRVALVVVPGLLKGDENCVCGIVLEIYGVKTLADTRVVVGAGAYVAVNSESAFFVARGITFGPLLRLSF